MDNASFWTDVLQNDTQCQEAMVRDERRKNEMRIFRTWEQRKDESDHESEDEPDAASLFAEWKHLMLHCATVSVDGAERCVIRVPFTSVQDVDVRHIFSKCGRDVAHLESPTWLGRALAEATELLFNQFGE